MNALAHLIQTILQSWENDVVFLSVPWHWFTIVPAVFYITFMVLKWAFLTLPIWLPVVIIRNCKD